MVKIAINGFGRIGKQFFLACMEKGVKWDFVINDINGIDTLIYSLQHDSVHPNPKEKIGHDNTHLYFGNKKIRIYSERDAEKLPWKKEEIDLVVECTGAFTNAEDAIKHINSGAKKVLISAPAKNHDCTVICGVNDSMLKKTHKILSAGSCTTNCVSPIVKILDDALKIKSVFFVTTHAYTSTQKLIDSEDKKDLRRGRAAAENIVPSTSGASQSVVESIPSLKGKISGYALRVPVSDGSISTIVARVSKKTNVKSVNKLFKSQALKKYNGIVQYTQDLLVSEDIIHNPSSAVLDSNLTGVTGDLVSVSAWYDNEWGYSNRLVDVAKKILK